MMKKRVRRKIVAISMLPLMLLALQGCDKEKVDARSTDAVSVDTPRYLAADGGKVYVSCYNPPSVVRIDTSTLKVEAVCTLGAYKPEGIAIVGGRLFVASTWIADEVGNPMYDNKVYVVDLRSFSVVNTVEVGLNPQTVQVVDEGTVAVNCTGNYDSIAASTTLIDVATLAATDAGVALTGMTTYRGKVYGYNAPYGSSAVSFFILDPTTRQTTPMLEGCSISNPYGINVVEGDVYVCTGVYNANGDVARYHTDGTRLWQQEAGVYASKVEPIGDGTAYILNEGTWGSSNASLDRINLASGDVKHSVFASANGRGLGDVAQDVLVYGSKAYVAVSFSNTVEAVSTKDNRSVQIAL